VTRDEEADGPLSTALRARGFEPVLCPVLVEAAPRDPDLLLQAAGRLADYDWIVCASARTVRALSRARAAPWPSGVRTAAVGEATARTLVEAGAMEPVRPEGDGADPLWEALRAVSWRGLRVLVPTTPGGRRVLIEKLTEAGAHVDAVEAYQMVPRAAEEVAREWATAAPDAVVIASPRVAHRLGEILGPEVLNRLRLVVAIGTTTAAAIEQLGVRCVVAAGAEFQSVADALVEGFATEVEA